MVNDPVLTDFEGPVAESRAAKEHVAIAAAGSREVTVFKTLFERLTGVMAMRANGQKKKLSVQNVSLGRKFQGLPLLDSSRQLLTGPALSTPMTELPVEAERHDIWKVYARQLPEISGVKNCNKASALKYI